MRILCMWMWNLFNWNMEIKVILVMYIMIVNCRWFYGRIYVKSCFYFFESWLFKLGNL